MPLAEHDLTDINALLSAVRVSIHVPLAEHDEGFKTKGLSNSVSIHVPLAEHDVPTS